MRFEPMYATTARELPTEGTWVFEPKYDGVRVVAEASEDGVRLVTRNGKDKAAQFPDVAEALQALARKRGRPLVLDGEVVALEDGAPARFQALQGRMHVKGAADVRRLVSSTPAAIVAFDLLADGDDDLTGLPWRTRRQRLERVLGRRPVAEIRLGETLEGEGATLLDQARAAGWEGLIAKRVDATYRPGERSRDWRKLKVEHVQEFVVGGWTDPKRTRPHLGALLLGYHDSEGRLVYAGNAGGGFTHEGLRQMRARLERLARKTSPFADPPRADETVHWVRPTVVVEVRFSEWTADGRLRQPIVLGVREDKAAREVIREPESVQDGEGAKARGREGAKGAKGVASSGRQARGAPPNHKIAPHAHRRATEPPPPVPENPATRRATSTTPTTSSPSSPPSSRPAATARSPCPTATPSASRASTSRSSPSAGSPRATSSATTPASRRSCCRASPTGRWSSSATLTAWTASRSSSRRRPTSRRPACASRPSRGPAGRRSAASWAATWPRCSTPCSSAPSPSTRGTRAWARWTAWTS